MSAAAAPVEIPLPPQRTHADAGAPVVETRGLLKRYGGVVGLSGGLIGPPGTPRDYPGSFAGTPIFLGCSDVDAHIPVERIHESADVLRRLGGAVDARIYPGMGHTINRDEIVAVRALLAGLLTGSGQNAARD